MTHCQAGRPSACLDFRILDWVHHCFHTLSAVNIMMDQFGTSVSHCEIKMGECKFMVKSILSVFKLLLALIMFYSCCSSSWSREEAHYLPLAYCTAVSDWQCHSTLIYWPPRKWQEFSKQSLLKLMQAETLCLFSISFLCSNVDGVKRALGAGLGSRVTLTQ